MNEYDEYGLPPVEPSAAPAQPDSDAWQTAVRNAVEAFVTSTGDSAKQLSAAAETFASETMRLMEDAANKVEAFLTQNRELAERSERAAEEASAAAKTALAEASTRFAEEARAAVDAHIQTSVQALSDRLAAESRSRFVEIDVGVREMEGRLTQLVQTAEQSVSEAMAAAGTAESAASRAAADFEARTAGMVEELSARATATRSQAEDSSGPSQVDFDAISRKIENAIARASDLALSAETAAAAARAAAEEARYSAEQSQGTRNESWMPDAAGPVLDRLEADYSLLTQVVRELNDRISGLSLVASPPPAPEQNEDVEVPATSFPMADLAEEAPLGEAPAEEESYEDDAPPANEPVYLYGMPPAPDVTADLAHERQELNADETAGTPGSLDIGGSSPLAEEAVTTPWNPPEWNAATTEPSAATAYDVPDLTADESEPESTPVVQLWQPMPSEPTPDFWSADTAPPAAAEEAYQAPEAASAWTTPETVNESETEELPTITEGESEAPSASEPEPAGVGASDQIEGRVTLNVSPIKDFDRLLSLDGALGRLPVIVNVTLADYARDEVTFRIELGAPVSVADFTRDLSETAGHPIEPVEVSEGHLKLHFTGMAA